MKKTKRQRKAKTADRRQTRDTKTKVLEYPLGAIELLVAHGK